MGNFDADIEKMLRQAQAQGRPMQVQQQIDPVTPVLLKEIVENSRTFAEQVILYAMTKDNKIADDIYNLLFGCFWPIQPQMLPLEGIKGIFFYVYLSYPKGVYQYAKHYQGEGLIDETCFELNGQKIFDKLCLGLWTMFVKEKTATFELCKEALDIFADDLAKNKKSPVNLS